MISTPNANLYFDVLCIGHASYDLILSVPEHPRPDEKAVATGLLGIGGGPAANAAVMVAKLGGGAGFCGYLGEDVYGESHLLELQAEHVDTRLLMRGQAPTPLSIVLVKPDGKRALINYKGDTHSLPGNSVDFGGVRARVLLFDGHEPHLSLEALKIAKPYATPSVLDAGSLHEGVLLLMDKVEYMVCSEKFAKQFAGSAPEALQRLAERNPVVVITLGEQGLIWKRGEESGVLGAPPLTNIVDTTGAGDAFHGAFAAALAENMDWLDMLRFASAAGGLCCTRLGARTGLPDRRQITRLLADWR
ncbi:MAG: PfkB family carbohydrate kinase [Methylomonas sp.]|jgi:sulfofructose kinase